ncbi:MAG TPA: hypothetical protein VG841_10525 [Caulobacterales bacterium]|nr:hypothetical protein [Caulobacterales bacterium]
MLRMAFAMALLALATPHASAQQQECFVVHGRLQIGNGTPSVRIWRIGTHRMLGVSDGPPGDELSNLPENVRGALQERPLARRVFGDFHVCALTPQRDGQMQLVRVESAEIAAIR